MSIALHIERLVIDEAVLGGERPAAVRMALERELAARLAAPGAVDALRGLGALDALAAPPLADVRHPRELLGARIAASVGGGMGIAARNSEAGLRGVGRVSSGGHP